MSKYRVAAREIRTHLDVDGQAKFLHTRGDILDLDDDDPRTKHYKDMRAIVPVRRKRAAASEEEPVEPADPDASGTAGNPAPVDPDAEPEE